MTEREGLIWEKVRNEDFVEMTKLKGIRTTMLEILTKKKGFRPEEIEINPAFRIELANCRADVSIDLAINLSSTYFMIIKCVTTAIESWERYLISFARAATDYQIPYAAITDGQKMKIFDVISDSIISESFDRIFDRKQSIDIMKRFKKIGRSEKKSEKEKRIIYAFENIKCPLFEQNE